MFVTIIPDVLVANVVMEGVVKVGLRITQMLKVVILMVVSNHVTKGIATNLDMIGTVKNYLLDQFY